MGEANAKKVGFFKGVKSEFKKIVWPNSKTLIKNTYTVIVVSLVIGGLVAAIDAGFQTIIYDLILGNL
ncbi:MAG: preprotein translocase subunit SecE [Vallitaleaceae bacterium]|nr:preprotein translocase subunit SecE [Vallitaleaceae bacterium]